MTATSYKFPGDFLDRVSSRIVNEVDGVCRVFYDSQLPLGDVGLDANET